MSTKPPKLTIRRLIQILTTTGLIFASGLIPLLTSVAADGPPRVYLPFVRSNSGARPGASTDLYVSSSPDGLDAVRLTGAAVSGNIYVFVKSDSGFTRVRFYIDPSATQLESPRVAGVPNSITGPTLDAADNNIATEQLTDGRHTLVAAIERSDGSTEVISANFVVANTGPALLFDSSTVTFDLPQGSTGSNTVSLNTSDGVVATYSISDDASWLSASPASGSTPGTPTLSAVTNGLAPGTYTASVTASASGYASASLTITLTVSGPAECTPVACAQIKVALPYQLDFSTNHGLIQDKNGFGTGFSYIDPPAQSSGYLPQNLTVDTASPGTLKIDTTKGIAFTTSNSLDNAMGVGIDAPSQVSIIKTTLRDIPAGSGANTYEQAGLWFGNNQDNYVKLVVVSSASGVYVQYLMEVAGAQAKSITSAPLTIGASTLGLSLRVNPVDLSIVASYQLAGGAVNALSTFTAPSEFFSFDAAGIDPRIGTRSFAGIHATHRNSPTPRVYTFNDFAVLREATPPPPIDSLSFERSSFPLTSPTSMAWGPDGRLYVSELLGKIHAITLNDAKQVVDDAVITTLGTRLTLGLTIDPASTSTNVILWASHSSPSISDGELNSSIVTRLSGPNFATREDVITGLTRAIANHAINSLHFGPDGKLYIVVGGNTGSGSPNTANTEFGTRAEQPLSAALLVADVKAAGFDGSCAIAENSFAPAPCSVVPYATGLRNSYDFVFHSNGSIYGPGNGLGVTGTFPPTSAAPCTGFGDTAAWNQGGQNPGTQPDPLRRIEQGKYYGHPNPYRNECVFMDGSYQGVAAAANYVAPIYNLGDHKSANGIIEYRSNAFNGALKGELLIANYSVGDDVTRIRLSADGRTVTNAQPLVGGFNNPLPLVEGPDGTIYVGEYGGNKVTALKPGTQTSGDGGWTTKQPMPSAVLDAGGTSLDGKLYSIAGKTSSGPISTMYIYTPATNSWTTGPNLPGVAVENPAVTGLNGKLYAFGGSTGPFSGAVTNAAVFDPATSSWTVLPAMPTARGGATAQAINGKIYVAGGMDNAGASLSTVEVYDTSTNQWSSITPMSIRRDNPGAAVLDGKLYVFGGRTRNADGSTPADNLASVEMYDPAANTWTARAPMPTGRRAMALGTLNSRAQLIGGERTSSGGTFSQNEEYDPATNTWRTLPAIPSPRHGSATGTIAGAIYIAGGGTTGGSSFSTIVEAFTLSTSVTPTPTLTPTPSGTGQSITWSTVAAAPIARAEGQGAVVNGRLYVIGGYTDSTYIPKTLRVDVYDPTTNTWTQRRDAPMAITHAGTAVDGNNIYLAGGVIGTAAGVKIDATRDVWKYDAASDTWTAMPPLPQPRGAGELALLGRNLHFFGGTGMDRYTSTADHWILALDGGTSWVPSAPLPLARNHLGDAVIGGKIYSIGGQTGHNETAVSQIAVNVWDPAQPDRWTQAAPLTEGISHIAAATLLISDNRVFIFGGETVFGTSSSKVRVYDPRTNSWSLATSLPVSRHSGVAGEIGGQFFYTTGSTNATAYTTTYKGVPVVSGNPTATSVPSPTPLATATGISSPTASATATRTPAASATASRTPTANATASRTRTPTPSPTRTPTPTSTSSVSRAVTSLTLINADTDKPISGFDPIVSGATLNFATLPTRNLNIRANTAPATVGSVRFKLDGVNIRTENGLPYALAGDNNGDYYAWTPSLGTHTLIVTPYSSANATGTAGTPITITFNVVNN